jgi:hypothetical protein
VRGRDSQSPTPARRRVRDDKGGPPVSDRGGGRRSGPCWAKSGAGLRKSRGACGGLAEKTREHGRTSADGLGPKELIGFFYFFRIQFSMRSHFQEILENVLKHKKYSENSKNARKIPRARLEHEQSK